MFSVLSGILSGGGAKMIGVALALASILGVGAYGGYRIQEGKVERAKAAQAEAVRTLGEFKVSYNDLQSQILAADKLAKEQLAEKEMAYEKSAKDAAQDYDKRTASILNKLRRVLNSTAAQAGGRNDKSRPVPQVERTLCFDGAAAFERFAGRLAECARSEAKLIELQGLVRNQ